LARSFNEMAGNLERLVEAQQAFVADASHQLRTPLAALRLRLENLEATVGAEERPDVTGALTEVLRLARLVDGLLVLARADATPATPHDVDVDRVIADRAASWTGFAAESEVELAVEGRAGRATLTPDSLEQILDNLIANAIEAAPPRTSIRLTTETDGDALRLHVIDEGPGMTAEERAGAFTRFLSTSGDGRSGRSGFGLGLAIAKRLARKDGGDLELRAAPGGGLDAVVHLPRRG
jgi:signal transduction histidine kinase